MIEPQAHRPRGLASCEECSKRPATRKVKFTARYLENTPIGGTIDEHMLEIQIERRVCEECMANMRKAENVSNFTFERL